MGVAWQTTAQDQPMLPWLDFAVPSRTTLFRHPRHPRHPRHKRPPAWQRHGGQAAKALPDWSPRALVPPVALRDRRVIA